jgi:hypothetical protein
MGLDRVRAVIVDDAEGIAARLDAEMQKTVDGFVDPGSRRIGRCIRRSSSAAAGAGRQWSR